MSGNGDLAEGQDVSERIATTEVRQEGFYWVILGQNPPEIAYWERGEWWLAGDPKPWQAEAVTVVSDRWCSSHAWRRWRDRGASDAKPTDDDTGLLLDIACSAVRCRSAATQRPAPRTTTQRPAPGRGSASWRSAKWAGAGYAAALRPAPRPTSAATATTAGGTTSAPARVVSPSLD